MKTDASNILSNYGRRHFKLFTDCHVSWDTLYLILNFSARIAFLKRKSSFSNLLSIYVECKKVWLSLFYLYFFNNFRIWTKSFYISHKSKENRISIHNATLLPWLHFFLKSLIFNCMNLKKMSERLCLYKTGCTIQK